MAEKNRISEMYKSEVVPSLMKEFGYKNVNEVPKLVKITLNMGLGNVKDNSKSFNTAVDELTLIAGQKAVPTVAKKAISNFKLRENMKIGARVTLRGTRMYEFFDRLVSIALPRVRDLEEFQKNLLMAAETILWASKNNLFSQKLFMTKSK